MMKKIHLKITERLIPDRKPYIYTACNRTLHESSCQKLIAISDFSLVTCKKCIQTYEAQQKDLNSPPEKSK